MSGMNSRTKSAVTALRDGLPELPVMNQDIQPLTVKINQFLNIRRKESDASESRMLRRDRPTIHIHGLAKFHGNHLRLRVGLEITGEDEIETPAKIFWKVAFIKSNAYEEIGRKTRLIKLPPQYNRIQSDDYLDINLNDIKPNFEEDGRIELEWEARLVWFFDGPLVDPNHKIAFCFHQIYDILDTYEGNHKLHEEVEQVLAQDDTAGLQYRE